MSKYKKLTIGPRVDRDDGRFYIPVSSDAGHPSKILFRVASDAFNEDEAAARAFAKVLVNQWNFVRIQ